MGGNEGYGQCSQEGRKLEGVIEEGEGDRLEKAHNGGWKERKGAREGSWMEDSLCTLDAIQNICAHVGTAS